MEIVSRVGSSAFERKALIYGDNIEELEEKTYGSYKVVGFPKALFSLNFVECLGVALYDPKARILGLAHVGHYCSSHIDKMIKDMEDRGASVKRIRAKLSGETWRGDTKNNEKDLHSDSIKEELKEKKIPLVAEFLKHGVQDIIADSTTGEVQIYRCRCKPVVI